MSIIVGLMGISKGDIVLEAGTGAGSATAMFSIAGIFSIVSCVLLNYDKIFISVVDF